LRKPKFLIDIVQVKYDAYARVLRDTIVDHDADSQANDVRRAQDLQFAANFKNLFYSCSDIQYPKDIMEFSVPELITLMNEAFFSCNKKDVWNQRFSPFNITAEDGIALMKLDALQVIMKRYGKGDCGFTLLGCRCNNSSNCSQSRENDNIIDVAVRRLELVVVYPLILVESFKKRWNPGFDDALFGEDFRLYYGTHLIGDEHSLVDNNKLCVICKKVTLQNFEETDKQDILYKVLKSAVFSFAASKVDSVVLTD
jgi:hypothetical protein